MRETILAIAAKHGYVVNRAARNLRTSRTQTLSVAIPLAHELGQALTDPFFTDMLGHLADEITRRGYGMYLEKILPPMDDWLPKLIASRRSDGIIVIGQSTEQAALERAAETYTPLVVWGGHLDKQQLLRRRYGQRRRRPHGNGTSARVRAPADRVRRRPFDPRDPFASRGLRVALERARRGHARPHIINAHMTPEAAHDAMSEFIDSGAKFDAVFAATDIIAISSMRAIAASGLCDSARRRGRRLRRHRDGRARAPVADYGAAGHRPRREAARGSRCCGASPARTRPPSCCRRSSSCESRAAGDLSRMPGP